MYSILVEESFSNVAQIVCVKFQKDLCNEKKVMGNEILWDFSVKISDGLSALLGFLVYTTVNAGYELFMGLLPDKIASCACAGNAGNVFPRHRG